MSRTRRRRYPGLNYFTEAEKDQFFGRDEEIEELLSLILSEKIVVLFGKSGYGKSSLLRAGILPRLPADLSALVLQLGAYQPGQSPTPVATVLARLDQGLPGDAPESAFLDDISDRQTLWYALKRKQNADRQRFLLIFDQFEEFDSYPAEQKAAFKQQLAELLFTRIPQAVRDRSDALSDEQQNLLAKAPDIRVVFAIREDRLSMLDGLADKLPAILHKRFRLQGLSDVQAREAVVKPAALAPEAPEDGAFASPPFAYSTDALDALLRSLKKEDAQEARVESFLLQICCEHLEQAIIERSGRKPTEQIVVTPGDLPAFNRLFEEYYRGKIEALPGETARDAARRMIEDDLVKADPSTGIAYRINVDGRQLTNLPGVDEALLKRLTDDFLLRSEPNTTGGFSYEVSHDRLVEGILNARAEHEAKQALERATREEIERLQAEAEEQERAAQVQAEKQERLRRQNKANFRFAAVASTLFLIALFAAILTYRRTIEAKVAREYAEEQRLIAEQNARDAQKNAAAALIETKKAETATQTALAQKAQAERNLAERKKADAAREAAERAQRSLQIAEMLRQVEVFIRADELPNALAKVEAILALDPANPAALEKKAALRLLMKNN